MFEKQEITEHEIIIALEAENTKLKSKLDKLTTILEEFGFLAAAEAKLEMERETALPSRSNKTREQKMFKE